MLIISEHEPGAKTTERNKMDRFDNLESAVRFGRGFFQFIIRFVCQICDYICKYIIKILRVLEIEIDYVKVLPYLKKNSEKVF